MTNLEKKLAHKKVYIRLILSLQKPREKLHIMSVTYLKFNW